MYDDVPADRRAELVRELGRIISEPQPEGVWRLEYEASTKAWEDHLRSIQQAPKPKLGSFKL